MEEAGSDDQCWGRRLGLPAGSRGQARRPHLGLVGTSSAIVKFAVVEPESEALRAWRDNLDTDDVLMTCELAVAEVTRAVCRVNGDVEVALAHLDSLEQFVMDRDLMLAAGNVAPAGIRTLDVIHLAAALAAGEEFRGLVTYDARMCEAARGLGCETLAPG
ncbi:MAG: type II toxin-antitoxin system VapC family toxin [Pseudonocardiaceae bacterium]